MALPDLATQFRAEVTGSNAREILHQRGRAAAYDWSVAAVLRDHVPDNASVHDLVPALDALIREAAAWYAASEGVFNEEHVPEYDGHVVKGIASVLKHPLMGRRFRRSWDRLANEIILAAGEPGSDRQRRLSWAHQLAAVDIEPVEAGWLDV